jgi:hypothetical protein
MLFRIEHTPAKADQVPVVAVSRIGAEEVFFGKFEGLNSARSATADLLVIQAFGKTELRVRWRFLST